MGNATEIVLLGYWDWASWRVGRSDRVNLTRSEWKAQGDVVSMCWYWLFLSVLPDVSATPVRGESACQNNLWLFTSLLFSNKYRTRLESRCCSGGGKLKNTESLTRKNVTFGIWVFFFSLCYREGSILKELSCTGLIFFFIFFYGFQCAFIIITGAVSDSYGKSSNLLIRHLPLNVWNAILSGFKLW